MLDTNSSPDHARAIQTMVALQSPNLAQIRNVSIVSLSGHRRAEQTVEMLRDEISALADQTEIHAHSSAFDGINNIPHTASKEPRRLSGEVATVELDTGPRGNSLCSIVLASTKGDRAEEKREGEGQQSRTWPLKVNLISCLDRQPSPNAAAAIRVTDSILMILGVDEHTSSPFFSPFFSSTVQNAVREACKPVIFLDRLDEILFSQTGDLQPEDLYRASYQTIYEMNGIINNCLGRPSNVDLEVDARQDTVLFGSTAAKWGFSLTDFTDLHDAELAVDKDGFKKHLWGDFTVDASSKKWTLIDEPSTQSVRFAFIQFILAPILEIRSAVVATPADREPLASILTRLKVRLPEEDETKRGRELFNAIMRAYLPIRKVLRTVIRQMPSPFEAQKYRAACLYSGPLQDDPAMGLRQCDPEAPLLIYATQFFPAIGSRDKLFLLGRIFAGKLSAGQDVRIHGPGHRYGAKSALYIKPVGDIFTPATGKSNVISPVAEASAGDLVLLSGLGGLLQRSGTISGSPQTHNIRDMYYPQPTIQYIVHVTVPGRLPDLMAGFTFLCKTDLLFESSNTSSGQNRIFASDASQVEANLQTLRIFANDPLVIEGPLPMYRETITAESSKTALSKSPNKHNRLYVSAAPLDEDFTSAIEAGVISPLQEPKSRAATLREKFSWEEKAAQKIWAFGPGSTGPNVVVDTTRAVQFLHEIQYSFVSGFQWASAEGPLAGERLRGVRLNVEDVVLFSDAIHRGGGQIIPTVRRVTFASMLLAKPRLVEPKYLVQVQTPEQHVVKVHSAITQIGGTFSGASSHGDHLLSKVWNAAVIQAYMPLEARLKLEVFLQQEPNLSQHVSIESVQGGWQEAREGDPLDKTSEAGKLVLELRKKNGLSPEIDITNVCVHLQLQNRKQSANNYQYLDKL